MRIKTRFFYNIGIILFAGIFSVAILFLIKHPNLLQASALNIDEIHTIKMNKRDIAYKNNNNLMDIFFDDTISQNPIKIMLSYDPSLYLDFSSASGQCEFIVVSSNNESTLLDINCNTFLPEESILIIPFSWENNDILIEEAYYLLGQSKENLSIGNLSLSDSHSN